MAIIIRSYHFPSKPPSLVGVRDKIEEVGGLVLRSESQFGSDMTIAFECIDGSVSLQWEDDRIVARSDTGESPVLLDLLDISVAALGGKRRGTNAPELPLPLTPEYVSRETVRYRQELSRSVLGVYLYLVCLVLSALGVIVGAVWLVAKAV